MTQVVTIDLYHGNNAVKAIQDTCDIREAAGMSLRGCFESGGQLILIFQTAAPTATSQG